MQQAGSFESAVSCVKIKLLSSYIVNGVGGLQTQVEVRSQGQVQSLLATAAYASVIK